MSDFFVPGGTMKPGAPSYIPRHADEELYQAVLAGEYCTVLTTRQMGKSSLMARTAARLREQSVACATVDLQGKGDKTTPPEQWYYGVAKQIADGLELPSDWSAWWKQQQLLPPAQRLTDLFADMVLKHIARPVVVFVDEVDWTIDLPFSDEFFAAIRSCFNRRAMEPAFSRLTFVLLGSASPAQLIKSATRTPFNIGHGIELTDFTPEEAGQLAAHLGEDGDQILARILHWTDGHPYLTQMLCATIAEADPSRDRHGAVLVDSTIQATLLSPAARQQENNLKFVGDRLTQATGNIRRVLRTYRNVLRGKPVKDIPASHVHTSLRLSGVVKPDAERRLQVRNRIYRQVFDERWVREKTPVDMRLIVGSATALVLVAIFSVWYVAIFPRPYVQALETASQDVQVAYNAYEALRKPFYRAKADDLLGRFFERRSSRDEAILVRARAGDGAKLAALVGPDYPILRRTFHGRSSSVAFSPDGKLVATGDFDGVARVIELADGREVSRLAHGDWVKAVAFNPTAKLVATASKDQTARLFEAATGREASRLTHSAAVESVAFSRDGKLLATGSEDKIARVFEALTGRQVLRLTNEEIVYAVAFSPDGKLLATGSNPAVHVFYVATGQEVFHVKVGLVNGVAFSPDGRLLATGSADSSVHLVESDTGRLVSQLPHNSWVTAVAFSPNSKLLATGSWDHLARVFEVATGREVCRLPHADQVWSVAFSPDGKLLATASPDGNTRIFDVANCPDMSRLASPVATNAAPAAQLAKGPETKGRILSSDGAFSVTQTGEGHEKTPSMETYNWLHLYQKVGKDSWRPIASRFLPILWPNTVRFLPESAHCPRCVEVVRDVPGNPAKLDRINFDEYPPPIQGDPQKLVEEWGARLGLKFDSRGRIVPLQP
jgi:WD40 repeat protein